MPKWVYLCLVVAALIVLFDIINFILCLFVKRRLKNFDIIRLSDQKFEINTRKKYKANQKRNVYIIEDITKVKEIGLITIIYGKIECRRYIGRQVDNRVKKNSVIFLKYLVNKNSFK